MTTSAQPSHASDAPSRSVADRRTVTSVCGFCSTGCGLDVVHSNDSSVPSIVPSLSYPVNAGAACCKGWEALQVTRSPDRGVAPLRRDGRRMVPISWSAAMQEFCTRFKQIQQRFGKESVAFLGTGQIATEEMVYLGALAKFGMGLVHGDGNTRQCMSSAATAYKESFGFDAPPYTYRDLECSDVIVLIGANLCVAHPIMWQHILRNRNSPRIVVVDPRRTETAMAATDHIALRPKSDLVLLYGIAHLLIAGGCVDERFVRDHTKGFGDFVRHVKDFAPSVVSERTGVSTEQLKRLARTIDEGGRVSFWWTMGVNQSYQGTRTAQAIINLALMTGNIGRPGTGANSITGQCNAMGSRLFSNTASLFCGRDFTNAEHRREVADALRIDVGRIPSEPSWPYHRIVENILRGRIRGLWIVGTNPAHSWINQNTFRDILGRLEFLVVQDMYPNTETATSADLYLPAAGWGEKEGTFINSERRIGRIRRVHSAPGEALSDFSIFRLVAESWGCGDLFRDWDSPESVFQAMRRLSQGRPCDISGIRNHDMIDMYQGIQWPLRRESEHATDRRLFEDGLFFHEDGRARFVFDQPREMPERPNRRFPLLLLTGRGSVAQWHTETRTSKSSILRRLAPKRLSVEIHPHDARREKIAPGDDVVVESQRGRIRARAFITPTVPAGSVFVAMHDRATNRLTHAHFDTHSHQPSYKDCAVRVRRIEPWDDV